ncbi:MAG: AmmeMemoRadiSam system protein B, partial [Candidatus Atribacteria bacterium]
HALDARAIERILALDVSGFRQVCRDHSMSICGTGAIELLMWTMKQLGTTNGHLARYATSGDVTGDRSAVVGYASVVLGDGDTQRVTKETHG